MGYLKKVPAYLVDYYKLTEKTVYETEVVDGVTLLDVKRFDQGAKLYYIRSRETGRNTQLAERLYDRHIEAFQDGIVREAGNADKSGLESYHKAFDSLMESFREGTFDIEREWIPVDGRGQIMDGAHRLACAVYFGTKVKVIRFPEIEGRKFDYDFFRKRGLERGYLQLMGLELSFYRKDVKLLLLKGSRPERCRKSLESLGRTGEQVLYGEKAPLSQGGGYPQAPGKKCWCIMVGSRETEEETAWEEEYGSIRKLFGIDDMERKQDITISAQERKRCRRIRWMRGRYTKLMIAVKKLLGMPV